MRRTMRAAHAALEQVQRAALGRLPATVVEVDYTSDPMTAKVKLKATDKTPLTVACYRQVPLEPGDEVDIDLSVEQRPRIRGVISAPVWHTPTYENSWVAYETDGHVGLRWRIDPGRLLRFHGAVTGGTLAATIFTLPDWAWPSVPSMLLAASDTGPARIVVDVDGTVAHAADGSNAFLAFSATCPL